MEGGDVGDALCGQSLGVVSAACGVDHLAGFGVAVKGPGDGRHGELAVDDGQGAGGVSRQVNAAHGDHFDALGGIAAGKLVVGEDVDGHIAAGALLNQLGKVAGDAAVDLGVGAVDRHDEMDLPVPGTAVRPAPGRAAAAQENQAEGQGEQQADAALDHRTHLLTSIDF